MNIKLFHEIREVSVTFINSEVVQIIDKNGHFSATCITLLSNMYHGILNSVTDD